MVNTKPEVAGPDSAPPRGWMHVRVWAAESSTALHRQASREDPAVFFNCSREGIRALFCDLDEIEILVAPWQKPSFTLEAVMGESRRLFKAATPAEQEFMAAVETVIRSPCETGQEHTEIDAWLNGLSPYRK